MRGSAPRRAPRRAAPRPSRRSARLCPGAAPTALTSSDAHKTELRRQASLLLERKMWEKETLVAALDAAIEKCIGPDPTAAAPAAAPAAPASGDW